MLHILLLILKIIGIVLLAILVVALLLLFLPVSYKLEGRKDENVQYIKLRGGWLFHIIHFSFTYDEDIDYGIRIFGFKIIGKKEEQQDETEEKNYSANESINDYNSTEPRNDEIQKIIEQDEERASDDKQTFPREKVERLKKLLFQCKALFVRIVNKIKDILKNIQDTYHSFQEVMLFLKSEETKTAYNYVKEKIIKLIRHMKPRRIRGQVAFGYDSPDKTGQTLGMIGMVCSAAKINLKHFNIIPDFENKRFEGKFLAKGYFLVGVAGLYLLQMYMKKEVREILDRFQ